LLTFFLCVLASIKLITYQKKIVFFGLTYSLEGKT
jgi:hypothetical protein